MFHYQKIYYFVDHFNALELLKLDKKINIIYRNYHKYVNKLELKKLVNYCRVHGKKIFIANDLKVALELNCDGLYLPSFNRTLKYKNLQLRKKFKIIGSAHTISEIKIKELQNCEIIFISPLFFNLKKKSYLDIIKFNLLSISTKSKVVALGGINENNIKKLNMTKVCGFAAIKFFKGQKKSPPSL